jgi:protein phosphatase
MYGLIRKLLGHEDTHACGLTDAGLRRENNEDCFSILADRNIFIVADGMGGHNAGEVASAKAVKALDSYFASEMVELMRNDQTKIKKQMETAFLEVNENIFAMSKENPDYAGMGCALIMAFIDGNSLHTCHVGDVRCYVCNPSDILQLTNDHSEVGELVRAGKMTADEARRSEYKNIITQAIGGSRTVMPEYQSYVLKERDRVILCSDGLWDMLSDEEIQMVVTEKPNPSETCKELIERANAAGGMDNITVVVIEK